MYKAIRKAGSFFRKSLSLVLAFSMMISVCMVSAFSVSAAGSGSGNFYLVTTANYDWQGKTVTYKFANAGGNVLSGSTASGTDLYTLTAPSGATKLEVSRAPFTLPSTVVKDGYKRIFLNRSNVTSKGGGIYTYSNPYIHYYEGTSSGAVWPGNKMTQIGSTDIYYADIPNGYKKLNFSDQEESGSNKTTVHQTDDQTIVYYDNYAYFSGGKWENPHIRTADLSGINNSEDTVYMDKDENLVLSKFNYAGTNISTRSCYVYNENWKSFSQIYASYSLVGATLSDSDRTYVKTLTLTKETVNGLTMFRGTIPYGTDLCFHVNRDNFKGASWTTTYPTVGSYDGSGYTDSTASYKITTTSEAWMMRSEINSVNYGAIVDSNFPNDGSIVGVEATYIDYWSDMEQEKGYLQCQGKSGDGDIENYWYQFDNFNSYISRKASAVSSTWKYPLYFGNMFKGDKWYNTFENHASGLTNINDYDDNYYYAVNNSNGMKWGGGNYNQSLQGLVYPTLDSKGDLQVANGVKAPYFDAAELATAEYNDKKVASVFKSYFPFRASTDSNGVSTYSFTSKNATDNVYFTWNNLTPTQVNYGAGTSYGVQDALTNFGGSSNGYGIFPFNNTSNTSSGKGTNYNQDYGFGIRLDIDFRVPAGGKLSNGQDVAFDYTGDDDLWVFIGEDPTGANAELVLDLGGDHKEAKGNINFNTMKAIVNDSFANYGTETYNTETITNTIPSDEIWVQTSQKDFCLYVWQDTSVAINNNGQYFITPYQTSNGYCKFKKSQLGNNSEVVFCKWQNVNDGRISTGNVSVTNVTGKTVSESGSVIGSSINYTAKTKSFNGGEQLDPNKTYHMVVFYMERGESESNFSVGFSMTPANNDLVVNKTLDTGDTIKEIADDLKANESYSYTITDNDGVSDAGKTYVHHNADTSTSSATLGDNGSFGLKDSEGAEFENTFKTGSSITVTESEPSPLEYDTSWELINDKNGQVITDSTDKSNDRTASFNLKDPDDKSSYAALELEYLNTIKTAPLSFKKSAVDEEGNPYEAAQQFSFKIELDLDGNGSKYGWKAYPVKYASKGSTYNASNDGIFTVNAYETIELIGLPVGAGYRISEQTAVGFKPYKISIKGGAAQDFNGVYTGQVAGSGNEIEVTNMLKPISSNITVKKNLDDSAYTGSKFKYTLSGLPQMTTSYPDENDGSFVDTLSTADISKSVTASENGVASFSAIQYEATGYYRFMITESYADNLTNEEKSIYNLDGRVFLVEVSVTSDGSDFVVNEPTYYVIDAETAKSDDFKNGNNYNAYFTNNYKVNSIPSFENTTNKAKITVNKKNQADENVDDTVFALVRVTQADLFTHDELKQIAANDGNNANRVSKGTTVNGTVVFDNLDVYKAGKGCYGKNNDGTLSWTASDISYITGKQEKQVYCLFEYSPANGYNPTSVVNYYTFPIEGKLEVTAGYVDGAVVMPEASGSGMNMFLIVGLALFGTGAFAVTGYMLYDRNQRKKRRARYKARH